MHTFTFLSKVTYVSKLTYGACERIYQVSINTPGVNWGK